MKISIAVLACTLAWPLAGRADEERPPLPELLRLNHEKIFGGDVGDVGPDHATVKFTKGSQFEKGFTGTFVSPDAVKGDVNRRILKEKPDGKEEKDIPNPTCVARQNGDCQSRIEVKGGLALEFKMRVPNCGNGAFTVSFVRGKNSVQVSNFQSAMLVSSGKKKRAVAPKEMQAPPDKWFDKNRSVKFWMGTQDKKFVVKMNDKEVLAIDEGAEACAEKVVLSARNLTLVLSDLTISGSLDPAWCEAQVKDLEAKGLLVLKEKPSD